MVYPADRTTCLPAQVTYAFRVNSNALICIALDSVSLTQYNTGTDNPSKKLVTRGLSGRLRSQASLRVNLFRENCFTGQLVRHFFKFTHRLRQQMSQPAYQDRFSFPYR